MLMDISIRRLRVNNLFRGQKFPHPVDIIQFHSFSRDSCGFTIRPGKHELDSKDFRRTDHVCATKYINNEMQVETSNCRYSRQILLHEEIDMIFADRRVCDPLLFANFIEDRLPECSTSNVALFVRLAGKKSVSKSHVLLKQHLPTIAMRLQTLLYSSSWRLNDLSSVIYGLQCLTAKDPGYLDIAGTIAKIGSRILPKTNTSSSKNLSMLMYGLRRNSCNEQQSRNLLKVVTKIVIQCNETLSAQAVGNSLYGLQNMSNNCIEVNTLVSALTVKVKGCTEIFSAQELSNALYGLQGMSSDNIEVRSLLSTLIPKIQSCRESFGAQAVGNSLYGLQGMSCGSVEVRAVISALTVKVKGCTEIFSAQELSNALYGLQGMSSDNIEVRSLLSTLIPKIQSCRESFGAQAVGNSLYGLQGMSCGSVEVRAVISALTVKVKGCEEPLGAQAASNALYGLQGSIRSTCSQPLLDTLLFHFCNLANESKNFQLLPYEDIKSLGQGFAFSLLTLHDYMDSIKYRKWEMLSQSVDNVLSSWKCDTQFIDKLPSVLEQRFQAIALKINFSSDYRLSFNESLFHLFEGDMVLRIPSMDNGNLVINFEIDGTFHLRRKKINFCLLRDRYLQSRGVIVERLPTARFIRMRDNDVAKWILEKVNNASLLSVESD